MPLNHHWSHVATPLGSGFDILVADSVQLTTEKAFMARAALGEAEDVCAREPFGVHDGLDVVDPLLEGGRLLEAIGAGHTPLVELEHADVSADVLARAAKELTRDDWEAVRAAVPTLRDPLFDGDPQERYRALRRQIAMESSVAREA